MSKNCGNCDYQNEDHSNFCQACGTPLTQPTVQEASQASPMPPPVPQTTQPPIPPVPPADVPAAPPVPATDAQPSLPKDVMESATVSQPKPSPQDRNVVPRFCVDENSLPVSVSTFFIMMLLFSIPLVNIIMMIIWAVGSKNKSKQNFAIAALIWFILAIILCVIGSIMFAFFLSLSATMLSGSGQDMFDFMQKLFNSI